MAYSPSSKSLTEGTIVRWNAERGFGFLRPAGKDTDVFMHISTVPNRATPAVGSRWRVQIQPDPKGRGLRVARAVAADSAESDSVVATARRSSQRALGRGSRSRKAWLSPPTFFIIAATLFCCGAALWTAAGAGWRPIGLVPLAYLAASLLTFVAYALDKNRARNGLWRTPESTLHGLELLGGWPGGWVAQQTLRHKSRKRSYQMVFWLIVMVHLAAWILILGQPEPLLDWLR